MTFECPFCSLPADRIVWENELAIAIRDGYPVSKGHTLVIPRRHVATWFDATPWEQQALFQGVDAVRRALDTKFSPHGYNVGFNAGEAAGQTVMHLHIHVIPRFHGDMDDPRGGVRGVIPGRQKYDSDGSLATSTDDPFESMASFVHGEEHAFGPEILSAMRNADEIDIVAAFVQQTGIEAIEGDLVDAIGRGAQIRLLTGDYLGITHPYALQRLYTLASAAETLSVRLFETGNTRVFHPKAYIFARGPHGVAYIGSSNLSRSALSDGVEWNLKTTHADPATFNAVRARFEKIFKSVHAKELTAALVAEYQHRVRIPPTPEPASTRPQPRDIQVKVLESIAAARADGQTRGLVVMATGLGKTFLSAFDFEQQRGKRALFVAHREEILQQAAFAWGSVHPDRSIGLLNGETKQPDADLVFASVQTLSRAHHLKAFSPTHFDYIVIDEFHHAAAGSYRKLLAWFKPQYLLGLTATPDRLDGAALLELCDDNLVARVSLVEGIQRGDLVPFRYFGVRDEIDFESIPWRSGRFDREALTTAAATEDRAAQALREYQRHAPKERRALVFCCTQRHADFIADYFRANGVVAAAVHSGPTSAPRVRCLQQLRDGEIEAIVAVDVFNEGVDLPDVNMILMLRPTESPIIFLQQLGRGLRLGKTIEKPALTVVDFIGNHRSFLVKPQALVALAGYEVAPGDAVRRLRIGLTDLPPGCHIQIETAALDILEKVAKIAPGDTLLYTYSRLRDTLGRRPTARETFAAGAPFQALRKGYTTWFDFVDAQGDLKDVERDVLVTHQAWFADLMATKMSRSYKMVVLEVLDDYDWLHSEVDVTELSTRCGERMRRDPLLAGELEESEGASVAGFAARWREMPLKIFHDAKSFSRQWFMLEGDRFVSRLGVALSARETFDEMTAELVEMRLREHAVNHQRFADNVLPFAAPIELAVGHAMGDPILRFDRTRRPDMPEGDVSVHIEGERYTLRFLTTMVRVAVEQSGGPNVLPKLMRVWFGPTAGQPGTQHRVELRLGADGRRTLVRRHEATTAARVIPLRQVPFYPELEVACGIATGQFLGHDVSQPISVETPRELDPKRHFVIRASGDSMNGGKQPIADGDLVLCEWTSATAPHQVEGRTVLLTGGTGDEVLSVLKIPIRVDNRWVLRSANPDFVDRVVEAGVTLRVVANVLEVVQEQLGPVIFGRYDRDAIAGLFGQKNNPSWRTGHRDVEVAGSPQTILMVNLRKPDSTPIEHLYADKFVARDELQWESQATTKTHGAKGTRIVNHKAEGRSVHLFVRYHTKGADKKSEPYTYCGTLDYLRHEGEQPMRVWFRLQHPLPAALWQAWSDIR